MRGTEPVYSLSDCRDTQLQKNVFKENFHGSSDRTAHGGALRGEGLCEETDFFCGLSLMQRLENERLFAAMQGLSERERYIFLSKVLGEMSLSEIALSLGITYGATAMSYHRTVSRLRNAVGGGKGE